MSRCTYEPRFPPEWRVEDAIDVEEDYYEIPRGLQPPTPSEQD